MACVVNMDGLFKLVRTVSAERQLASSAQNWMARRLPAEAARRMDWTQPTTHAPSSSDDHLPEAVAQACRRHVQRAIERQEPLVSFMISTSSLSEIRGVADWLASLPTEDPDMLRKLPKVTWAQAVDHSRRWHERLAKQNTEAASAAELADGTQLVVDAPLANGWHWVRLTTEEALDREGQAMGHCVGSGGYDRLLKAKAPDGIYSLRDSRGRPHVTVEVRKGIVEQAQGKGNAEPTGHTDRMAVLVQALSLDIDTGAPGLFGMARIDGRLMPIDLALEQLAAGPLDGHVNLSGYTSLNRLPDGMKVRGWLNLSDCTSLTHLPDGLTVGSLLNLKGCTSLNRLPDGLTVRSWLNLTDCTSLTHLPDGMKVDGGLFLSGCTSLTHLPDGMTVGGWLDLRGCTSLTHLPDGMTVGGNLYLYDRTSLTYLPDGMTVGGNLYLSDCTSLTHLPDGMTVGGWLDLTGCTSLTHLPDGMTVGGELNLTGCTLLTHLPDDMDIQGRIRGAEHLPRRGTGIPMVQKLN